MNNIHVPVLLKEMMEYLSPQLGQIFVDGTLGGGGYTLELLNRVEDKGKVLAIDLDQKAVEAFRKQLAIHQGEGIEKNLILVQDNFKNLKKICHERGFNKINGIVLDLGLSSNQLEDQERGFSFRNEGILDMRYDTERNPLAAYRIINTYSEEELTEIFKNYGEEVLARPIAQEIIRKRKIQKIVETGQLAEIVTEVYRRRFRSPSRMHPATKVFQALRIAVNDELGSLEEVLPQALELLEPQGKIAIVSFHSLEDRIVKNFFRTEAREGKLKLLTKKPLVASEEEINSNPRARSAKLRVAEKV